MDTISPKPPEIAEPTAAVDLSGGDGGVLKTAVVQAGSGATAAAQATVSVHFECRDAGGRAAGGSRPGPPFTFQLGRGDALECIELATGSMREGERAEFTVRGRYAAEASAAVGVAVRGSEDAGEPGPLTFTIEVTGIYQPGGGLAGPGGGAASRKKDGNAWFKAKDYAAAMECYRAALELLHRQPGQPDERLQLEVDALNNLSLCCLNTGAAASALLYCNEVLRLAPTDAKALNRRSRARLELRDYAGARQDLDAIIAGTDGTSKAAREAQKQRAAVGSAEGEERRRERDTFGRAFAMVGVTLPTSDSRDPSLS
eukprot:SAG22_NODE_1662_length_3866_cov_15.177064_1_plen_315_part_00